MAITSTINTRPSAGASFAANLEQFLAEEDADRFDIIFNSFVDQNGLHGTSGGLVGDPGDTIAFPAGFYVTETGTITYNDNTAHHWVIIFKDTTTVVGGNFIRVSGTHYLFDPVSVAQPAAPAGSLILMDVVTSGGAITTVTDLRNLVAFAVPDDVFKVKVSSDDTTSNFLLSKLTAGAGITLTETNPGANEEITIAADSLVTISTNDTTPGFLEDKITSGDGIKELVQNAFGNEDLLLDIDLATTSGLEFSGGQLQVNTVTNGVVEITSNGTVVNINGLTAITVVDEALDEVVVWDQSQTGERHRKVAMVNFLPNATQAEAETGTLNTGRMTALRVDQALENRISTGGILQADIGAAQVGQGELKTSTGDLSVTGVNTVTSTGVGGEYGFWGTIKSNNAGSDPYGAHVVSDTFAIGTSFLQRFTLTSSTAGRVLTLRHRFIQASPPYNLGDGDIFSFIFALVNNSTGLIEALYHAPDPPWANNGPTNIRPDRIDPITGKRFKTTKSIRSDKTLLMNLDFIGESEVEVTNAFKNSDMGIIPHPFVGNDLTGKTVIMFDPMSVVVERLEELKNVGGDPSEIIYGNFLNIGNTELGRARPSGVMSVSVAMK